MTYEQQVKEAVDTIIDTCAYHEGCQCDQCEAKGLCHSNKPLDLLHNSNNETTNVDWWKREYLRTKRLLT